MTSLWQFLLDLPRKASGTSVHRTAGQNLYCKDLCVHNGHSTADRFTGNSVLKAVSQIN